MIAWLRHAFEHDDPPEVKLAFHRLTSEHGMDTKLAMKYIYLLMGTMCKENTLTNIDEIRDSAIRALNALPDFPYCKKPWIL
jgi:hypothetical protein